MIQINATQLLGLLSFGTAAVLCYKTWRQTKATTSTWGWLTIAYLVMAFDTVSGGRHLVSNAIRMVLKTIDFYTDRKFLQMAVTVCLLILAVFVAGYFLRIWFRQKEGTRMATYVTFCALLLFIIETISLHKIDAILYQQVGPVLLIGWIWTAFAVLIAFIAIGEGRGHRKL